MMCGAMLIAVVGNMLCLVLVDGVSIVDLSDPSQPVELYKLPGVETTWRDLKTFQEYAYVSNEGGDGLRIIDLRGLPDSIHYRDTVIAGMDTGHNIWVDEFGYLYMVGGNVFSGGMAIYDLNTDPWSPSFAGFYDERYVHDVYVRDNIAYLAEIFNGQLSLLDVSDKSDPQIIGIQSYPNGFTHNTWLNDAGDVCFTTDEYSGAAVIAWDVSDPGNIQELGRVRSSLSNGEAAPHNVHVLNDYLITSYYKDGLHITDASRPNNLVEVGYYDTSPLQGGGLSGAWGAYPFMPSGHILISDVEEGLFVLLPDFERACYLEGVVRDAEIMVPLSGVEVSIQDTLGRALSQLNGNYQSGVADSGMYEVRFTKYGYRPDTSTVVLDNGVVTTLNIDLIPSPRVDFTIEVLESGSLQPIEGAEIRAEVVNVGEVFIFQTDLDGEVHDPRFVIDSYRMIVGKWGYVTQEHIVIADSANPSITFLLEPGYYDDFALDFGWTVEGNPRNGSWERGEPVGTYETFFGWGTFNPEYDLPDDIGEYAYVTGNQGGSAFSYDVDRGFTQLVSPPIDLSLYQHPHIIFHRWFVNWSLINQGQPGNDFFRISLTDGIDTFAVRQYTGPFDTTWTASEIRVEKYFPADRDIRVLFYTQDFEPGNQDAVEAAIDGFRVIEGFPLANEEPLAQANMSLSMIGGQQELQLHYDLSQIVLSHPSPDWYLDIFSLSGQRLRRISIDPNDHQINLPFGHPPGMYLGRISSSSQIWGVKRFVKTE